LVEVLHRGQGTGRAGRRFLIDIAQPGLRHQLRPVMEIGFDQLRERTQCEADIGDPEGDEPLDQHLYDGPIAEWHPRLWEYERKRMKPHPLAARKYHGAHTFAARSAAHAREPPIK
jgi:hypothetical protein